MNSNIDFSAIWKQNAVDAPEVGMIISKAKQFRNKTRMKLIGTSLLLLATAVYIIWVGVFFQPELISTKIGMCLVIMAIIMIVLFNSSSLNLLFQLSKQTSVKEQLIGLTYLKRKQERIQGVVMTIYFIMLSLGIGLYMFEYALRMTLVWSSFAYSITAIWILFNWFFLRKRVVKKQRTEINTLISDLERMDEQLKE